MTEYQRRWRLFGNGLLQAAYSGFIVSFGMFVVNGMFSLGITPKQFFATVGATVAAYVIGWARNNGLPPIFEIDEAQVETLVKVAEVVKVADADIADVAKQAEADIHKLTKE